MSDPDGVAQVRSGADFDALAEGVIWQDGEGRVIDANEAAGPLFGLTKAEILGGTSRDAWWQAVHEDGTPWPASEHPGMTALRTGEPQRMQIMGIASPRFGRRWLSLHAMPQFAAGASRPTGVVSSFMDVTAQIESRHRMQLQASELAELYDKAPCGYHTLDAQGQYMRINDTELGWLGVTRESVIGSRCLSDFLAQESKAVFEASFSRIKAGEPLDGIELELVDAGGGRRWVRMSANPVQSRDGAFVATRSVLHDITESRAARAELERLNEQQRLLLDNDLVGIVRIKDRRVNWMNRAFGRMFGYELDELVGRDTAILYPDQAAYEAFGQSSSASMGEGRGYRSTVELRRKDGAAIWVDCTGARLDPATGEAVWFSMDVTEARRAEALRIDAANLSAENRLLQETARLHRTFLSNMSHELRTPLNAVIGFADMLQRSGSQIDDERRVRFLGQIAKSGKHLLDMIESMLDLSSMEAGRVPLQPRPIDLRTVMQEVTNMLESEAQRHKVSLATEFSADLPTVNLDPLRLKQVLINYLGNAIKFCRVGGNVVARASMRGPGRICIEVQDDGVGISEADQGRLFVRFQQLSAGSTKAYEGTGIGLALVKQIVEAQGGRVGVRSALGQGSTFWVELPVTT